MHFLALFTYGGELYRSVRFTWVAAVDPEEGGTLMWALCFALSDLGGDARTFCRLLKLFVTEFGLSPPVVHLPLNPGTIAIDSHKPV
jgi:hypothetical protein